MSYKVVILAMVGTTDLQCLVEKDGAAFRAVIGGDVRAFHEAMLRSVDPLPYTVDGSRVHLPAIEEGRDNGVKWVSRSGSFDPKGFQPIREDGKLVLVPAKLGEVLEAIRAEKDTQVVAAVLLNTHRIATEDDPPDLQRAVRNEPVAAGPVLARWCAETLRLSGGCGQESGDYGMGRAGWVNYLHGKMMAEGEGRDFPVSRKAVKAVEDVIRRIYGWDDDFSVCLSLGGGLPMMKDSVKACAEFFFAGRVFNRHAPQLGKPSWARPEDEPPAIAESYRTRRHVAHLIRQGDFVGAARAGEPFRKDEQERSWVECLEHAADYMAGGLTRTSGLPPYLTALTVKGLPSSVIVALRVEAALSMGRTPEAVAWTCTLLDAALKDFITQHFSGTKVDWLEETIYFPKGCTPPERLTTRIEYIEKKGKKREDMACLEPRGASWAINTMTWRQLDRWMEVMGCVELRKLKDALHPRGAGRTPAQYRNMNQHGTMPPRIMREAERAFQKAGLWYSEEIGTAPKPLSRVGTNLGALLAQVMEARAEHSTSESSSGKAHFLDQELIHGLFVALGVPNVGQLYRGLAEGLIQDLYEHEVN